MVSEKGMFDGDLWNFVCCDDATVLVSVEFGVVVVAVLVLRVLA